MSKITLQVPMENKLRLEAEKVAMDIGFSSLQEVVRLFLKKLVTRSIDVGFYDTGDTDSMVLSDKADKRYSKMVKDIKKGKNIHSASSIDELMAALK